MIREGKRGGAVICFPGLGSLSRNQCPSCPDGERLNPEFLFSADAFLNEGDLRSGMHQK